MAYTYDPWEWCRNVYFRNLEMGMIIVFEDLWDVIGLPYAYWWGVDAIVLMMATTGSKQLLRWNDLYISLEKLNTRAKLSMVESVMRMQFAKIYRRKASMVFQLIRRHMGLSSAKGVSARGIHISSNLSNPTPFFFTL